MIVLTEFLGAIALLLWGLRMVRTGVMRAYGSRLNNLGSMADGKILPAFLSGLAVAIVLQSSTATALIAASFAGQGVLSVSSAFLTILGADIGTALAVLVASQKITFLSPALIAIGVFGFLSMEKTRVRNLMRASTGLGLILLALSLINALAVDIAQVPEFTTVLGAIASAPVLLLIFAAGLTYLAHSSLAIVLLSVSFVAAGVVDMPTGLVIVLGANIGGGLLPVIASWTDNREVRAPVTANILTRLVCVVVAYPLVDLIAVNIAQGTAIAFAPALFHLGLNVFVALVGVIFAPAIMRFSMSLLPPNAQQDEKQGPKYLDAAALGMPPKALANVKREAIHIAEIAQTMLRHSQDALLKKNSANSQIVSKLDEDIDRLHEAIKIYVAQIMQSELGKADSQRALDILSFTVNMDHIGDIIDTGLMDLAERITTAQSDFSAEGLAEISKMFSAVSESFDLAINTFVTEDVDLAKALYAAKAEIRAQENASVTRHLSRIGAGSSASIETSSIHLDVLRDLKRINSHLTAIAYPVMKAGGEVPKTKWKQKRD